MFEKKRLILVVVLEEEVDASGCLRKRGLILVDVKI